MFQHLNRCFSRDHVPLIVPAEKRIACIYNYSRLLGQVTVTGTWAPSTERFSHLLIPQADQPALPESDLQTLALAGVSWASELLGFRGIPLRNPEEQSFAIADWIRGALRNIGERASTGEVHADLALLNSSSSQQPQNQHANPLVLQAALRARWKGISVKWPTPVSSTSQHAHELFPHPEENVTYEAVVHALTTTPTATTTAATSTAQ